MLDKTKLEDSIASSIKGIVKCQTHLASYDYDGVKLKYPRVVVDVQAPEFLARQSNFEKITKIDEKTGRRTITQQYLLDVVITCVGSPKDNLAYLKMQELRGVLHADYDIIFPENGLENVKVNSFGDIEDISLELPTKIESRYRMVITLSGSANIYDRTIAKIVEVNPQIVEVNPQIDYEK